MQDVLGILSLRPLEPDGDETQASWEASAARRSRDDCTLVGTRDAIREWLTSRDPGVVSSQPGDEMGVLSDETMHFWKLLSQTSAHLPGQRATRQVVLVSTSRISAKPGDRHRNNFVPAAVLPLNVIVVRTPEHVGLEAGVCQDFDISACCIGMRVHEDATFSFYEYHDAFKAARDRRLLLRPTAFSGGGARVASQMERLQKYIHRGFAWA